MSPLNAPGPESLTAIVEQDASGIYWALNPRTGRFLRTTSSRDAADVVNALFATPGFSGLVGYYQDLNCLSPIQMVDGCGIAGQGPRKNNQSPPPAIYARTGFAPANDGLIKVPSTVVNGAVLLGVMADAQGNAEQALTGTGDSLQAAFCSFYNGTSDCVNSNGGGWNFYSCGCKQSATGLRAWNHGSASDAIWVGGYLSGGQGNSPTLRVQGGNGHVIGGLHVVCSHGGGNCSFACDNSIIFGMYLDDVGDTNGAAGLFNNAGQNVYTGIRIRCGPIGNATGCVAIRTAARGMFLGGTSEQKAGAPNWANAIEDNGTNPSYFDGWDFRGVTANGYAAVSSGSTFPMIGPGCFVNGVGLGEVSNRLRSTATSPTLEISDRVIMIDCSGANRTATLPDATLVPGKMLAIKKTDAGGNNLVAAGSGGQTVDGAASVSTATARGALIVVSDGSNWQLVGVR